MQDKGKDKNKIKSDEELKEFLIKHEINMKIIHRFESVRFLICKSCDYTTNICWLCDQCVTCCLYNVDQLENIEK